MYREIPLLNKFTKEPEPTKLYEKIFTPVARKTFIDILIQAGVPENVICEMMGHVPGSRAIARYKNKPIDLMKKAITDYLE